MKITLCCKNIRRGLCLIAAAGMMTGCAAYTPVDKTPSKIRIGVTLYDEYDTFLGELMQCFNQDVFAKQSEGGPEITVNMYGASKNQAIQNDQVKEMINNDCDVLCVNLVDRTAPTEIIDFARSAGIPVIFFNRELVEEDLLQWDQLYYVGADAFQSGTMQGELAVDAIRSQNGDKNGDGSIQYIVLEGEAGHQDAIVRSENSVNRMVELGVKLDKLGYGIANWNQAQAETKMNQFIDQYGSDIELVLANNDEMALGAIAACKSQNIPEKDRPIILGIDGTKTGLQAVKDGEMYGTVFNDSAGQAQAMFELAYQLATTGTTDGITLMDGKYIRLDYQKITKDNVDDFIKDNRSKNNRNGQ